MTSLIFLWKSDATNCILLNQKQNCGKGCRVHKRRPQLKGGWQHKQIVKKHRKYVFPLNWLKIYYLTGTSKDANMISTVQKHTTWSFLPTLSIPNQFMEIWIWKIHNFPARIPRFIYCIPSQHMTLDVDYKTLYENCHEMGRHASFLSSNRSPGARPYPTRSGHPLWPKTLLLIVSFWGKRGGGGNKNYNHRKMLKY